MSAALCPPIAVPSFVKRVDPFKNRKSLKDQNGTFDVQSWRSPPVFNALVYPRRSARNKPNIFFNLPPNHFLLVSNNLTPASAPEASFPSASHRGIFKHPNPALLRLSRSNSACSPKFLSLATEDSSVAGSMSQWVSGSTILYKQWYTLNCNPV